MLNAAGKAKFRPFTQAREIRGEGAAMADAIANWQRDVSAKYGSQWIDVGQGRRQELECSPARPGTIGKLVHPRAPSRRVRAAAAGQSRSEQVFGKGRRKGMRRL